MEVLLGGDGLRWLLFGALITAVSGTGPSKLS